MECPEVSAADEGKIAFVRRNFKKYVLGNLDKIPFGVQAVAAYRAMLDPKVPFKAKAVIAGALAYLIIPTDLMPDFFPFMGYVDDAAAFTALVGTVAHYITDLHRQEARAMIQRFKQGG